MCAYYGWLKHSDAKNLLYKIQSLTGVRYSNWNVKELILLNIMVNTLE